MAKYSPGTLDDEAYIERSRRDRNRQIFSNSTPTDSQIYGVTEAARLEIDDVRETAEGALEAAQEALARSYEFVDLTADEIDAMFEEVDG